MTTDSWTWLDWCVIGAFPFYAGLACKCVSFGWHAGKFRAAKTHGFVTRG